MSNPPVLTVVINAYGPIRLFFFVLRQDLVIKLRLFFPKPPKCQNYINVAPHIVNEVITIKCVTQ